MNALTLMLMLTTGEIMPGQEQRLLPEIRAEMQPANKDLVLKWNEIALQAIKAERSPPPVAARNLAMMHIAIYDAVVAIEGKFLPHLVEATTVPGASAKAAAVVAAHRTLWNL